MMQYGLLVMGAPYSSPAPHSALRRGLMSESEAQRHGKQVVNVAPPFELTGLGQLLELQQRADRLITFA